MLNAILTAALFWLGTGLHPVWYLAWFAPIPILLAAPRQRAWIAFALAFAASTAGSLNTWQYFTVLDMPIPVRLLIIVAPSVVFAACVLLWRWFYLAQRYWPAALALPLVWTATDFLQSLTSIHGTAGSLAYSQMDAPVVLQIASITGIWGITFVMTFVPSAFATRRVGPMAAALAVLVADAGFGYWRIASTPASSPTVTVGMAAIDYKHVYYPSHAEAIRKVAADYAVAARQLSERGAQLVVFPEKIIKTNDTDVHLFDDPLLATGIEIFAGIERWTPNEKRNEIRHYAGGIVRAVYEKQHMLPPFESHLLVGNERVLLMRPQGRWGLAICKDMDFADPARGYGRDGAGLMIVPAWDFDIDGWQHGRMAILRGVENGYTIVRAPKQGILTISDDRGRVLAEKVTSASEVATLVAAAPVRHTETLYSRLGPWFGWLVVAALVLLLTLPVRSVLRCRRPEPVSA